MTVNVFLAKSEIKKAACMQQQKWSQPHREGKRAFGDSIPTAISILHVHRGLDRSGNARAVTSTHTTALHNTRIDMHAVNPICVGPLPSRVLQESALQTLHAACSLLRSQWQAQKAAKTMGTSRADNQVHWQQQQQQQHNERRIT